MTELQAVYLLAVVLVLVVVAVVVSAVRIPIGVKRFLNSPNCPDRLCELTIAKWALSPYDKNGQGVMLLKHFRLLPRLRMNAATPPHPSTYMCYYQGVHWLNFLRTCNKCNYPEIISSDISSSHHHDVRLRVTRASVYLSTSHS